MLIPEVPGVELTDDGESEIAHLITKLWLPQKQMILLPICQV